MEEDSHEDASGRRVSRCRAPPGRLRSIDRWSGRAEDAAVEKVRGVGCGVQFTGIGAVLQRHRARSRRAQRRSSGWTARAVSLAVGLTAWRSIESQLRERSA